VTTPLPAPASALWQHGPMHKNPMQDLINTDRRGLLRAAARLLGPGDAEDAVQDAYLRALEADGLTLDSTPAWLLTVVRHLAIDHWRRRQRMVQWTLEMAFDETRGRDTPSAEADAALAQEVDRVMQRLAARLTPMEGAALLLHEVFQVEHAEIAEATGRSAAANRQQLRRALQRMRHEGDVDTESDADHEHVLRAYLLSLRTRNPDILWSMLREPPIRASARRSTDAAAPCNVPALPGTVSTLVQLGGQLGLALSLDGVRLCVVPLGVHAKREPDEVVA
jgi:RNA polymerase sigma factor (sigma-70 family)